MTELATRAVEPHIQRDAPLEMTPDEFRKAGYELVETLAAFLGSIPEREITRAATPTGIRAVLGDGSLPEGGADAGSLLRDTAQMLINHSLLNGHPRFMGYVTSSPAPIGTLADLLASMVNPNVGAWTLSPMASEIERQTIRWIAELIGYPQDCGGLLVSGGNMANFVGVLAARRAKSDPDIRSEGLQSRQAGRLLIYTSGETHTWIQKASDLFGFGTSSLRWIPTDDDLRMDPVALRSQIEADIAAGHTPIAVVGTAGTVSTGAIDPLPAISAICREHGLWLHVDGAYGAFAAMLPDAPDDLKGLALADSIALDPHKWLYSPLEAGCTLVRDASALEDAFSFHPSYYHFGGNEQDPPINYYNYGMQNSRGFRVLKVWLSLRQAGRSGYERMISDDIRLSRALHERVTEHAELQAFTQGLSISTFRYVPAHIEPDSGDREEYLNRLNEALLTRLQEDGDVFVSNAVIDGTFLLRACVVNFRTSMADVEAIPGIIAATGREVTARLEAEHC